MTNLEKFEEVFGIKLDPVEVQYTYFPCECVDADFCDKYEADCDELGCPAQDFWTKEYVEKNKLDHGRDGVS